MKKTAGLCLAQALIAVLVLAAVQPALAQKNTDITLENNFIKVVISPETKFYPALRIREFYNKLQDDSLNLVLDDRWLELDAALATTEGSANVMAWPATARIVKQGADFVTLRSPRFIQANGDRPFPLQTVVTFRLVKNKVLVFYTLKAKAPVVLASPIRLASFFNNRDLTRGEAYIWTGSTADTPIQTFKREDKPKFTNEYRPANHVRLIGSGISVDIYSPDGGMDQVNLTKEKEKWIVFSELIPNGQNSTTVSLRHNLTAGETINRAITIVAGFGDEPLREIADPTAMFSPYPGGASNVIIQAFDDVPSVTVAFGEHWNVPGGAGDTSVPMAAQMINLLETFPTMKANLQVIWDSMIGVAQDEADERTLGTAQIAPETGASADELWRFHNIYKRVAAAPGLYHQWLRNIQNGGEGYFGQLKLGNGSYHYRRLDKVSLYEWENDPLKTVPAITAGQVTSTFGQIAADAAAAGLTLPKLFRAPADRFSQVILDPVKAAGTEVMIMGNRQRLPHLLHTTAGDMVALYWNWDPSFPGAEDEIFELLKRGWPVVGVGTYFDGTGIRLELLKRVFNKVGKEYPRAIYVFAEDYARFVTERKGIVWMGEEFDDDASTLTVRFRGRAIEGQTLIVAPPTWVDEIVFPPTVNGKQVTDYFLEGDRLFIVLPALKQNKEHTVVVKF